MGKLVRARGYPCYRRIRTNNRPTGPKLGGVATAATASSGPTSRCPLATTASPAARGAAPTPARGAARPSTRGCQSSRRSRSARRRGARRCGSASAQLEALKALKLTLAAGQRVVLDAKRGIGTAADLVATRGPRHDELVILELKTGYAANRKAAATDASGRRSSCARRCRRRPTRSCTDTWRSRGDARAFPARARHAQGAADLGHHQGERRGAVRGRVAVAGLYCRRGGRSAAPRFWTH